MKIGIDYSPALLSKKAGIGHYTKDLTKSLIKHKEHFFYIFVNSFDNLDIPTEGDNYKFIKIFAKRPNFFWILRTVFRFYILRCNIFISTSNLLFSILIKNSYQIIHDISPILHPEYFIKKAALKFKIMLKLVVLLNRKFFYVSEFSYKEMSLFFKKTFKKNIIYGGVNSLVNINLDRKSELAILNQYNLADEEYILSVSTLEPRKNYVNAIKAFFIAKSKNLKLKYVIVGKKGWLSEEIFNTVKFLDLDDSVIFLDYVEDKNLKVLYKNCSCVVMISWYEGLGLPILEALYLNKKVVVSDIDVFKEIIHTNLNFVDPDDPNQIAEAILDAIKNSKKSKNSSLTKGHQNILNNNLYRYSWESVAQRVFEIISEDFKLK